MLTSVGAFHMADVPNQRPMQLVGEFETLVPFLGFVSIFDRTVLFHQIVVERFAFLPVAFDQFCDEIKTLR